MPESTDKKPEIPVSRLNLKTPRRLQKDRDEITVAKSIFDEIVEFTEHEETPKEKRARKAGLARAEKLTPEERSAIAKKAAETRWKRPA